MQYVFSGTYREFRGYVFANHKPVTIQDRGTLEAIKKDPSFKEYHEEEIEEAAETEVLKGEPCPKCGKLINQGRYMHVKWCKG